MATSLHDARMTLGDSLMRTLLDNPALMQCSHDHVDRMWAITIRLSSIISTLRVQQQDGSAEDMQKMMCARRPSGRHGIRRERSVPLRVSSSGTDGMRARPFFFQVRGLRRVG